MSISTQAVYADVQRKPKQHAAICYISMSVSSELQASTCLTICNVVLIAIKICSCRYINYCQTPRRPISPTQTDAQSNISSIGTLCSRSPANEAIISFPLWTGSCNDSCDTSTQVIIAMLIKYQPYVCYLCYVCVDCTALHIASISDDGHDCSDAISVVISCTCIVTFPMWSFWSHACLMLSRLASTSGGDDVRSGSLKMASSLRVSRC